MKLKIEINEKIANAYKSALAIAKKLINHTVDITIVLTFSVSLLYMAVRAPELHGYWLRSSVGSKVYTIKDNPKSGGGTGFAIQAPSGASYILTNDHVCNVSKDKQTVLVQNESGLNMRRRILARADFTDLCLIEGIPGVEGLKLSSVPMIEVKSSLERILR
jgi:S1-C subfamily serine protease